MGDYSPTLWLPRSTPGSFPVSAALLNKVEQGVRDAHGRIAAPCYLAVTANIDRTNWTSTDIAPGERVLLVGQTDKTQNGVHVYDGNVTLTRDAAEIYTTGRLFPVVKKNALGVPVTYSLPAIWVLEQVGVVAGYTFEQVSGSGEAWRYVGQAGQPALLAGAIPAPGAPRFFKDPMGMVHLEVWWQSVGNAAGTTVFTLPPGYRPSREIGVRDYNQTGVPCIVDATGAVKVQAATVNGTLYTWPPFLFRAEN